MTQHPTPGDTTGSRVAPPPPREPGADASVGEMLAAVTNDLSTLMRQEVALAKAEAQQSAAKAGRGAGMLGGAGAAGLLALIFVSLAAAWGLGHVIGFGWSSLVVGVVWAIVAAILAASGKKQFKDVGMPQTAETTARIPDALKGNEEAR